MRTGTIRTCLLLLAGLFPATVLAGEPASPVRLTLPDTVQMAARQALGIRLARLDREDAAAAEQGATAAFDTFFRAGASGGRDTIPSPGPFNGGGNTVDRKIAFSSSLQRYLDTGTTLGVDWTLGRSETNNRLALLNPAWSGALTISVSQHFLRGFGRDINRAGLEAARHNRMATDFERRNRLEQVVLSAAKGYWICLQAKVEEDVRWESLKVAERTLRDVEAQIQAGTLPEMNRYKAKAELARRSEELAATRAERQVREQELLATIWADADLEAGKGRSVELSPLPDTEPAPLEPIEQALQKAVEKRAEVGVVSAVLQGSLINRRVAKNRLLPTLDVSASYTQYGARGETVSGSGLPIPLAPGTLDRIRADYGGGAGGAMGDVLGGGCTGFALKASLVIPLGNREARAGARRAEIAVEKGLIQLEKVRQGIALEVRTVYRNLDRDKAMLEAAKEGLQQAVKDLEGEQARFEGGVGVLRDLLEAQRNLASARARESQARTRLALDRLDLDRSTGDLLPSLGLRDE